MNSAALVPASMPDDELVGPLDEVIALGADRLPNEHLRGLRELRGRIDERRALGHDRTVVAVVGGTGVGKSAVVNRLVGSHVVREGVRRPTTDHATAVVGAVDPGLNALLDWLGIDDVRVVDHGVPDGLVLLDLPDHDSVAGDHRRITTRLAARVDAVLLVVDPLKYARADLHEGPLADLSRHAQVLVVALNRTDELAPGDIERCIADLTARLVEGHDLDVEVVPTSARTGSGIEELRAQLGGLAAARTAADDRLRADAAALASSAREQLPDPVDATVDEEALAAAVIEAAGGTRRLEAAAPAYRSAARRASRSPAGRLLGRGGELLARLRPAPLGSVPPRARRDDPHAPGAAIGAVPAAIHAELAVSMGLSDRLGHHHTHLAARIDERVREGAPALAASVARHDPQPEPRRWWRASSWLHGAAELAALTGLMWLLAARAGAWLGLPPVPRVPLTATLSLPAALLLGGLLVRLLSGVLVRISIRIGARRHRRRQHAAIRSGLSEPVRDQVLIPLREAAEIDRRIHHHLGVLAAGGSRRRH